MADPALTEKPMPVGYRFHPTDQELVGHYLRHKLMADDPSIHDTIPEIGVCKYEPLDLLARASSAASATNCDDFQCYFFSPRDYKYPTSNRLNRATSRGFWKVTGRGRDIIATDTNNVIGTKKTVIGTMKTLVFYEGRVTRAHKTDWVIHEYHDALLSPQQRTHVLCWLKKNKEKKTKRKTHQLDDVEYENQANKNMNSEEHYFLNRSSMVQTPPQSNEIIDSMIQTPQWSNEVIESMPLTPLQSNEAIESITQTPLQSNEVVESIIQTPLQSNESIELIITTPIQSNESLWSDIPIYPMIQTPFQSNEPIYPMIQTPFQSNEHVYPMIQTSSQPDEAVISLINAQPSEPNSAAETIFEVGEFEFSLFDEGEFDFTSLLQPSPSMDEQGPFEL